MKGFIQFIAGALVIALILVTVNFLVTSKVQEPNIIVPSGEIKKSGEEKSGEDEPQINQEEIIKAIDEKVEILDNGKIEITDEDGISVDIGGEVLIELLTAFEISGDTMPGKIEVRNARVELIFASDFLENQIFYYDEEGDLILYKSVSNTVGGEARYYFKDKKNLKIVFDYAEPEANKMSVPENVQDILTRATNNYNKYLKK